ncbi:type II secretion system F family protein [Candidatus Poriferisodalis sp.]|uniref:type II secretion system F family protein n=1 Tax=Candidatus Poriferisodalis sp. TaxID=3101277 RepID=UPI003B027488
MNVALTSGLSISASLQLAVSHLDAASGTGRLLGALAAPQRPLDEALEEFGRTCGPRARAFAAAVTGSLRTGIPLAPELERLGRELREDRRRRLEGKVRRLPVLLLFPLVLCVLPALGLVAIVPVLVAAFGG